VWSRVTRLTLVTTCSRADVHRACAAHWRLTMNASPILIALLASAALGCSVDRPLLTTPEAAGRPNFAISDAVHSGGNQHFYFLPPLVPQPTISGTFDGALSPIVQICEYAGSCGATVAQFSTSTGTGGATVDLDASASQYSVNWDTKTCAWGPCSLDPAKTYRLQVVVNGPGGSLLLGFADVDVVSNGAELKNVQTGEYIGLLNGRTLPIKFRIETGIVGSVAISPNPANVTVGQTIPLTATVTDLHGLPLDYPVTWASASSGIASVNASGLLTGAAHGCTSVVARSGDVEGSAQVTVWLSSGVNITSVAREPGGPEAEHLDSLAPIHFPRGGTYSAQVRGSGLCVIRSISFSAPEVSENISRGDDTLVVIVLQTPPVAEGDTTHAEIPGVTFTLSDGSGHSVSSGSVHVDIVKGPPPRNILRIVNAATSYVLHQQTRVDFEMEVWAVNNTRFDFVGGPQEPGDHIVFGPVSGRYGLHWIRPVSVYYTAPALTTINFIFGTVDGTGRKVFSTSSLPVVNP